MSEIVEIPKIQPELELEFSPQVNELFGALAKARKAFKKIKKTEDNPFYKSKYADLANLVEATVDGLSDNGLSVMQFPTNSGNGKVFITTVLGHASGQWAKARLGMPLGKQDAQGVGSAITYGRRYAYGAVLNIASEEDDDGNAATGKSKKEFQEKLDEAEQKFNERSDAELENGRIAQFQVDAFWKACKDHGKTNDQVTYFLKGLQHVQVEQLTRKEFNAAIKWANTKATEDLAGVGQASLDMLKARKQGIPQTDFKRLYAKAKEHNVNDGDLHRIAQEIYKVTSLSQLNRDQFAGLEEWVEQQQ